MAGLLESVRSGELRVGDGAMGTMLQSAGLDDGGAPELWNVDKPEEITRILGGYADAGAQILTTNTFGGSRPRLQMHGLEDRVIELNRAAAEIARQVADTHEGVFVLGDIGPSGDLLEPMGTLTPESAQEIFAEQITGLVEGGVDGILIETMSDLAEVRAAVAAAKQVAPDLPVFATLSFDTNLHTMMGVSPAQAVVELTEWVPTWSAPIAAGASRRCRPSPSRWWGPAQRVPCYSCNPTPDCRNWSVRISSITAPPRGWLSSPAP